MRKLVAVLSAFATTSAMLLSPGLAQAQNLNLKGQSSHPAASNFHLIFKLWAEQMEKMSGGRFKAQTQPGGAIVPPFEVFDAVSRGTLAEGSRFEIVPTAGTAFCFACGEAVTIAERFSDCPRCGGHQLQVTGGDELRIKELEVE